MTNVHLTFASSHYDHLQDFVTGEVKAEGIDVTFLKFSIEEIFFRFIHFREWDVSEMSLGKYSSLVSQGDRSLAAIPVFPSRVFRQSSIFVRADSPVKMPEALSGKRVGLPEWAQTASIYTRGWVVHQVGIPLQDIEWVQAGVERPGRREKVALRLPGGVRYRSVPDRSLTEMLLARELDAVMTAHAPSAFEQGRPDIVRLLPDYREVEEAYFRETGIFPIMHVIAIKRDVLDRHPWAAMNLFQALERSKNNSLGRALATTATRFPIPWCYESAARAKGLFGDDFFPYGIEPNRKTLEAFLQYAHEQGVCHRRVAVEELFPKEVQSRAGY